MKNKILIGMVLATCISAGTYAASTPQDVTVCLNVSNNTSGNLYSAGFKSTDFFDRTRYTHRVVNGEQCVTHHYNHGYKNIIVLFETAASHHMDNQAILLDKASCSYMHPNPSYSFVSEPQKTGRSKEIWKFNLIETPSNNTSQHVFQLTCSHQGF